LKKDEKNSIKYPQLNKEVQDYFVEEFYKLGQKKAKPSKAILRKGLQICT
jgi:hypothetical protein